MEWLDSFLAKKQSSKDIARDRLKLVIVHDRADCSTDLLETIKNEIVQVLLKYMDIDEEELDMQITKAESDTNEVVPVLYANIPIKGMLKR